METGARRVETTGIQVSRPGGRKSKIQVSAGMVPSEATREGVLRASLPAVGGSLAVVGIPWSV